MPEWANRTIADSDPSLELVRPTNGQKLDQILAELKSRPRPAPSPPRTDQARNITALHPPLMAELQALQSRIDHLADKMDSEKLSTAIVELADKVAALNAERSLGEAEMRLLRSIRRSLDDLIYHMTAGSEAPAEPQAAPEPQPSPVIATPVFGRRAVPPVQPPQAPHKAIWPQGQTPHRRRAADTRRTWPMSQFIARRPLASVAAAFALAIMVAAGVTQWAPHLPENTGSIRAVRPHAPSAASEPTPMAAAPTRSEAPNAPASAYIPAAIASQPSPVGNVPQSQTMSAVNRSAEDAGGITAYQAGVRLADGPARDFRGAIAQFEKAGDMPAAQFRLALLYERGQGAPKNPAMARALYQKAAEKGHVRAMHNLGVLYADGIDGKPDYASAAEWFRRAAEYGLRDSEYNLATLTARGLGVPKNVAAAYTWFALAAAQGDADAARQRDEIGKTLDAATLKSARSAAENFRPKMMDPTINQVTAIP